MAMSVAKARAIGVSPGTFSYKLHATVPLLTVREEFPPFQRVVDTDALFGSQFAKQAGERADLSLTSVLNVSDTEAVLDGSEIPQETVTQLPPGPILNLGDVVTCSRAEFVNTVSERPGGCPAASQIGVVSALFGGALADRTYPLYKLSADHGHLATVGFPYELILQPVGVLIDADLRADGDYGITLSSSQIGFAKFVPAPFITLWGVPAAAAHDPERWNPDTHAWGDSLDGSQLPLVANATDCDAVTAEARESVRYWSAPERWLPEDPDDLAYRSFAPAPEGCELLGLMPAELSPMSGRANAPVGIDLRLELARNSSPDGLEAPPLESAALTLPAGMSVNPAAADGLAACTPEQIGLEAGEAPQAEPIRFSPGAPRCPPAARIGDATVDTSLADDPIEGDVYLATPLDNPFRSLLALYLVFRGPGFTAKFAARVETEPGSERLRVSMDSLPPLPIDAVRIGLHPGPRAPLASPVGCGEAPVELLLTPSSAPQSGPAAKTVSRYAYSSGLGCAADTRLSALSAGSADATAAGSSPFVMRLAGDEIGDLEIVLPPGLAARVRDVGRCSEAEIARAEARQAPGQGAVERSDPSCPASSRVGSLLAGAGPGPAPLFAHGDVYLAGPYAHAPLSLVAITPALAGGTADDPLFDLGAVVDRVALDVNRRSGAVRARVDAPSRSLAGIPLRIATVWVRLDRPGFMRNPSSCDSMGVAAAPTGGSRPGTALHASFHSTGCGRLGFAPRLSLAALRGPRRGQYPTIRAVLRARPGEAGIASAGIALPDSELLDRDRLRSDCQALPLDRGGCPRSSIRGRAVAWSALLDGRLEGPVYLRRDGVGPPELVLALGGRPAMEIVGRVSSHGESGRVDFSGLPDAELTKLALTLWGGRRGLFANARDLCRAADHASARFVARSGAVKAQRVLVTAPCADAARRFRGYGTAKRREGR